MSQTSAFRRVRVAMGAAVLALSAGAGLPVGAVGAAAGTAAVASHLTPAIGAHPQYKVVGTARSHDTTFSCQLTSPAQCYGPTQIRAAYGTDKLIKAGLTGKGETITILDAFQSPTITSDLATFDQLFGLPAPMLNIIAPDGLTPFDQTSADQTSWAGEITLDVEYAHTIAPSATIDLVLAKSDQDADIYSAQKFVVSHNLGDVISQSFGEAEQCMDPTIFAASHKLFAQAIAQGQTVFASSADQGAALPTCDNSSFFKAVSIPASDPDVTGVGGTILDADGVTGAYHGETTWNEPDFNAAGGGGFSNVYSAPIYQRGLRLPARGVPDISYNAAIIGGVLAVWSSSGQGANLVFQFGGTSAGSPQWAGLIALADQLRHHRVGFINNALYALSLNSKIYNTFFHDVTTGDNTYHGAAITIPGYSATKGWDPATGLGTPKATVLVPALAVAG
jgi:subtilase family serine protease